MVGNVEFIVVNRHSFVRAALHECLRKPRGTKMIRFPLSTGDQGLVLIWWHFKTMPVYYDKNVVADHARLFRKTVSRLPAVFVLPNAVWLRVGDLS